MFRESDNACPGDKIMVACIDLSYCDELWGRLGCMANRRTDVYELQEK